MDEAISERISCGRLKGDVDEYVVAFLNAGLGGSLFYGVKNDGVVAGVALTRESRDQINRVVTEKLTSIKPALAHDRVHIIHHPVEGADSSTERFVVEVVITVAEDHGSLYFTGSDQAWMKTAGGKQRMSGPQITDEIIRRQRS